MENTLPDLIPYRKGDKWGYCTSDKRIVIDCIYDLTFPMKDGLGKVKIRRDNNWEYGYINSYGKEIISPIYTTVHEFSEGAVGVKLNRFNCQKWGFLDTVGKKIASCVFDYVRDFSELLAAVEINQKWGYIDISGNVVIDFLYDDAHSFHDGLGVVKMNGKYGFINRNGGSIPFLYEYAAGFSEGLACVVLNGKYGFIDKTGKNIIPCIYDQVNEKFTGGKAYVNLNGKYGVIDNNGNVVIPIMYDSGICFFEDVAIVKKDNSLVIINQQGKNTAQLSSTYIEVHGFQNSLALAKNSHEKLVRFEYSLNIDIANSYGYLNKNGKTQIPFRFYKASSFINGLAVVGMLNVESIEVNLSEFDAWGAQYPEARWDVDYGCINLDGEIVIPCIYETISEFSQGIAFVRLNDKCGYIDKNGTQYWEDREAYVPLESVNLADLL